MIITKIIEITTKTAKLVPKPQNMHVGVVVGGGGVEVVVVVE